MATVLKSQSPAGSGKPAGGVTGLAGFNLDDLADRGRQQLEAARAEIRGLIAEAEKRAETIQQQAEQRGYQEGLRRAAVDADKKLRKEADGRAKQELALIRRATEQLHRSHAEWMQQYAEVLNTVALSAAQRIVRSRLDQEPEVLLRWADEALRSTRTASQLTVAVHPEMLAELGPALDDLLTSSDLPEQTHVEADPSLARTDVVVRQSGGEIRAGLDAQLSRLEEMLS